MLSSYELNYPVFMATLCLYVVLAMASFAVQLVPIRNKDNQLRHQVNAWWFIFPVVSLSLLFYPLGSKLLTILIGTLALTELATHYTGERGRFKLFCMGVLIAVVACSVWQPEALRMGLPVLIAVQLARFIYQKKANQLLMLAFLMLCYGMSFIIFLADIADTPQTNLKWLFYLFVVTALNDIGQFISGTCFGKHKIAEKISPNKTWQGLFGGLIVSAIVSTLLGHYLYLASLPKLILFGVVMALGGFLGDLMFSSAKRFLRIKDFSALIPGHGGILDRVDSLVVTAPLLFYVIHYYN